MKNAIAAIKSPQIKIEFSVPSKMPGLSYGLPPAMCKTGSILRTIKGSACSKCYARKGLYQMAQHAADKAGRTNKPWRNLKIISATGWKEAFVKALKRRITNGMTPYFRWHDQGDLQSMNHLNDIVWIAQQMPKVNFWVPTHENQLIKQYVDKNGTFPKNLIIRISASMIDKPAANVCGLPTSTIASDAKNATCPAPNQNGECKDCRNCWDSNIANVAYKQH